MQILQLILLIDNAKLMIYFYTIRNNLVISYFCYKFLTKQNIFLQNIFI